MPLITTRCSGRKSGKKSREKVRNHRRPPRSRGDRLPDRRRYMGARPRMRKRRASRVPDQDEGRQGYGYRYQYRKDHTLYEEGYPGSLPGPERGADQLQGRHLRLLRAQPDPSGGTASRRTDTRYAPYREIRYRELP